MKIEIKKFNLVAIIGFICGVSGLMLGGMFIRVLRENGVYGIVVLIVFLISLIWFVNFWIVYKSRIENSENIAKQIATELKQLKPEVYKSLSVQQLAEDLKSHLHHKIEEDTYVLWGSKT